MKTKKIVWEKSNYYGESWLGNSPVGRFVVITQNDETKPFAVYADLEIIMNEKDLVARGEVARCDSVSEAMTACQDFLDDIAGELGIQTNAVKVREFCEATTEGEIPSSPIVPSFNTLVLREELIAEEYKEVMSATAKLRRAKYLGEEELTTADIAPLMHELADLLYVTYGAMLCFGVDPDAVFAEVHEANMRKLAGPRREDGKILKPEGWEPADVAAVIERLKGGA